jgi:hypothetical protein
MFIQFMTKYVTPSMSELFTLIIIIHGGNMKLIGVMHIFNMSSLYVLNS